MSEEIVVIEENEDKTITTIRMNNLVKKNAFGVPLAMALREAFDIQELRTRPLFRLDCSHSRATNAGQACGPQIPTLFLAPLPRPDWLD